MISPIIESMEVLSDRLASLVDSEHGRQSWVACKVRKSHWCIITKKIIGRGEEAYRPLTNKNNRTDRISLAGMGTLAVRFRQRVLAKG